MSYKHVLVVVDPSQENNNLLIDKAVMIAKASNSELSFMSDDEVYRMDHHNMIGLTPSRSKLDKAEAKEHFAKMDALIESAGYPVKSIIDCSATMTEEIKKAIKDEGIDLVVCCHHHSFWHTLFSGAAELMKEVNVDLFVVSIE